MRSVLALLLLLTSSCLYGDPTVTATPRGGSGPPPALEGMSCIMPMTVGDGAADDTMALQTAIDTAQIWSRKVCLQPGSYRYTRVLTACHDVNIEGLTLGYNFGVNLMPVGSGAFSFDGTKCLAQGNYAFRIRVSNLNINFDHASATNGIYVNQAYNIVFDHVFSTNYGDGAVTTQWYFNNVGSSECDYCVTYGNSNRPGGNGVVINGSGGSQSVMTWYGADIEHFHDGLTTKGNVIATFESPWLENSDINYIHGISAGVVTIRGGLNLTRNSGGGISVIGDHLRVEGMSFTFGDRNSWAFDLPAKFYSDVHLLSIPESISSQFLKQNSNLFGVEISPSATGTVVRLSTSRS